MPIFQNGHAINQETLEMNTQFIAECWGGTAIAVLTISILGGEMRINLKRVMFVYMALRNTARRNSNHVVVI